MFDINQICNNIEELDTLSNNIEAEKKDIAEKINSILEFVFTNSKRNATLHGYKAKFNSFNIWRKDDTSVYKLEKDSITYFYRNTFHEELPDILNHVIKEYYRIHNRLSASFNKEEKLVEQLKNQLT